MLPTEIQEIYPAKKWIIKKRDRHFLWTIGSYASVWISLALVDVEPGLILLTAAGLVSTFVNIAAATSGKLKKAISHLSEAEKLGNNGEYDKAFEQAALSNYFQPNPKLRRLIERRQVTSGINPTTGQIAQQAQNPSIMHKLNQTQATIENYLRMHRNMLKDLENKKQRLQLETGKPEMLNTDGLQNKYTELMSRYDNLIELQKAKLNFYEDSWGKVKQMKHYHQISKRLEAEESRLSQLESQYLQSSIYETHTGREQVSNTIQDEAAYIVALEEITASINNAATMNVFKELEEEFREKRF